MPDIKFFKDKEGNIRQVPVAKLDRFKELFPEAAEATEEELRTLEDRRLEESGAKQPYKEDKEPEYTSKHLPGLNKDLTPPQRSKSIPEVSHDLYRNFVEQPDNQFKAAYEGYKSNPERYRDEDAPEKIERRRKKKWYEHIGAGGSAMGKYHTPIPGEHYGEGGHDDPTQTRLSQQYMDDRVSKQDKQRELDSISDFLTNTQSGRKFVEHDENITKYFEELKPKLDIQIEELEQEIKDKASERNKIINRPVPGTRYGVKPSWLSKEEREKIREAKSADAIEADKIATRDDLRVATETLSELKRVRDAVNDRDSNAFVQLLKEGQRRLPETAWSAVTLGLNEVAQQLEQRDTGELTSKADDLFAQHSEMVENLYKNPTTMAQDIANGTLHSAAFMVGMAFTGVPASSIVRGTTKGLGRAILKEGTRRFITEGTKKGAGKVVRIAGKNIAEAFVQTVIMPSTWAGALEKNNEEPGSFLNAYAKNFIAAFGEVGLERAGDFMPGFKFKSKFMQDVTKYTHMNSFFPEIIEEDLQTAWHALFKTGEGEWSDLIDPRNRLVTAATIGLMQAPAMSIETVGGYAAGRNKNSRARVQIKLGLDRNVENMQKVFGDGAEGMMHKMDDYVDMAGEGGQKMPYLLLPESEMSKLTEQQRDALATYTLAQGAMKGMERAKAEEKISVRNRVKNLVNSNVNKHTGTIIMGNVPNIDTPVAIHGYIQLKPDGSIDHNKSGELYYTDADGRRKVISSRHIDLVENADPAQVENEIAQQKEFEVERDYANSQVPLYQNGEHVRFTNQEGNVSLFGEIVGVDDAGSYLVQIEGVPQPVPVEPRQIIPENHLKGVENNSEVKYIDDAGKTVVGVVNDAFTLRGDGIMVIDGKEVSTDNIMGLAENIEDHSQSKETETTPDREAVTETGIETTPEVETKTPEQLESEKQQLAEQTRQQQAEHQKKEFYDTLPVYKRGKNKGEFNVNKFTPEQKLKHFEYEVGKEATVEAATMEIENAEKRLKSAETRYKNDPLNAQKRQAVESAKAEVDFYKKYVHDARIEQTQQVKETSTSSIAEEVSKREQSRAEQEEAQKQSQAESEATKGVPDVRFDTPQAARNRGFRMVNGVRYDRQQAVAPKSYVETERKFSDKDVVPVKRTIVEADQVHPSHRRGVRNNQFFITEAQPKERTDKASQSAADNIASNINPSEITGGVTAYTGAPIINAHGEVLQGNNRVIGLQQMHGDGNKTSANKYKQHLIDNAADYGMTAEQVQSMNNPVAVDIAEVVDAEAIRLGQLDAADTESGGIQRIQGKQSAVSLGKDIARFSEIMFESNNEDAAISTVLDSTGKEALDFLLQKGIINPTQYESAFNKDGNITPEAKADLESIAAQMLFEGGNSNLEAMFDMLPSKAQKAILQTIHRNNRLAKGDRIIGDLQQAIEAYYLLEQHEEFKKARNYKEVNEATRAARNATSMFNSETNLPLQKYNNFAMELAMLFKTDTQRALRQRFNSLYNNIEGVGAELFADATKLSKTEAIKKHFNNIDYVSNGQIKRTDVAGDSKTGTEGQRDGARETERGERTEVRGESADSGRRVESDNDVKEKQKTVERISKQLNTEVIVYNTPDDIPSDKKDAYLEKKKASKGWYVGNKVYVVLSNHTNALDVQETLLHEIVGHKGIKDMLGKEKHEQLLTKIFDVLPKDVQAELSEKYEGNKYIAADEYIAKLAENYDNLSPQDKTIWEKVKQVIIEFIENDLGIKLTEQNVNDVINALLVESKNRLENPAQVEAEIEAQKQADAKKSKRNVKSPFKAGDIVNVSESIAGANGKTATILKTTTIGKENKHLIKFENGAEVWTNEAALSKKNTDSTPQSDYGAQNKIITQEQYTELRDKLRNKLNNLNTGFDPEIFSLGAQMAAYHIEAGAVKFKDFAQQMIADVGESVRPYLKSFYEGARLTPGFEQLSKQMDAHKDVVSADMDAIGNIKEKLEVDIPEGSIITSTGLMVAEGVKIKSGSFEIDGIDYDMYLRNGSRLIVLDQVVLYETEAKNVQDAIKEFTDRLNDNPGIKANVKGFVSKAKQNHVDLIESEKREQQEQREAEIREENKLEKDWEDALREEEALDKAKADVDTNPTEGQKEAGNYKKGHVTIAGLDITIENPKGSQRSGTDANGDAWSITMQNDYGYIKQTKGKDGDHIDIFIGDNLSSDKVFVVDQVDSKGNFDEHKVMLGFDTMEQAREAYLSNYEDGWTGLKDITETTVDDFKKWTDVKSKKQKAFAEYKQNEKQVIPPKSETNTSLAFNEWKYDTRDTFEGRDVNIRPYRVGQKFTDAQMKEIKEWAEANGLIFGVQSKNTVIRIYIPKNIKNVRDAYNLIEDNSIEKIHKQKKADKEKVKQKANEARSSKAKRRPSYKWITENFGENTFHISNLEALQDYLEGHTPKFKGMINSKWAEPAQRLGIVVNGDQVDLKKLKSLYETEVSKPINIVELSKQAAEKEKAKQEKKKKAAEATAEQGALFDGKEQPTQKIEDFGEVIEGAKKHAYERIEAKEGDIKSQPLSKTFPKPEYGKLVQEGVVSKKGAAALKFYYDQIGRKPRNKYRLSRWTKQVQDLLDLYNIIIDDVSNGDAAYNKLINNTFLGEEFKNFVKLQEAFGFPENDVNMGAYRVISPSTVEVAKGSNKKWLLVKGNYIQAEAASIEGIVEKFNSIVNNNKKKGKDVKLDIYQDTVTKEYFIGRKTGGGVIRLVDGLTRDAAIKMRKEENAKLQELWQASRIKPEERRKANRERTGKDYRDGKNITSEKFEAEFGFRGVQFGNWVNNLERQEALNDAYDAFMDLANVIGVSPRALSLAGELGMAFGARGSGNAMAHYESGKVVINLTKRKGAGSLAHEWWHAMDNYFSRMRGRKGEFITSSPKQRIVGGKDGKAIYESKVRKEMHDAFVGVMDAIKQSELPKRSKELDKTRSAPYWATDVEMSARAFESYIVDKLAETAEQNDYLANFKEAPEFGKDAGLDAKAYPYPMGKENATINEAFNNLFEAMQEKQKGEDVILFREKQAEAIRFRENQDFRDGHGAPAMDYETLHEATEDAGNVTLSEIITGKQELVPSNYFDTRIGTTRSGVRGYAGALQYGFNTKSGIESLEAIKSLQEKIEDGANPTELQAKVYRAIPNTVNVNELIDGDWITLSKDYAEKHGLARFGDGNYKIIEQNIPVNKIWWDGSDINELGYDVEENIRFRSMDDIIEVTPFRYGEGGTKGTFKGKDGTIYKSLQGGFLDWEDGRPVRRYRDLDTQEYIILKMLEDDSRFPQVGDRVETNEGAAFEIEKLERADNITFEEYVRIEETIQELNSKGIYLNDFISAMRRPGTNEVVINDFSNGVYDPSRIGNSYYNDVLFSRIEEILPGKEKAKLDKYKEDQRLELYRKLFPDRDITREDIRYRETNRPQFSDAIETVVERFVDRVELKENEFQKDAPNLKELVLSNDVKDYGMYDKYEIVPVSNPVVNIQNLNRSIYGLGAELKPLNDLHSQALLNFEGDTGYLNQEKVKEFSNKFEGAIEPYETALLKAKHFSTEAAQKEIMDILKDIDYAKDYYERLANDQSILRTEEEPRFRETDTPEFKAWFGDSKVVDEAGKPLVMYHGGVSDFSVVDPNKGEVGFHIGTSKQANFAAYEKGGFVNNNATYRHGTNIMPLYASIKNPIRLEDYAEFDAYAIIEQLQDKNHITKEEYDKIKSVIRNSNNIDDWNTAVRDALENYGYDGIVYLNRYESLTEKEIKKHQKIKEDKGRNLTDAEFLNLFPHAENSYIVFNPNQVKSATGNVGTFSKESNDIRYRMIDELVDETGSTMSKELRDEFDKKYQKFSTRLREAWEDQFLPVKDFLDILHKNGLEIAEHNDFYKQATHLPGKNDYQLQHYLETYQKPITKAVNSLLNAGFEYRDIENYLFAKHGVERNEYMRRAAAKRYADAGRQKAEMKALQDRRSAENQLINETITQEEYDNLIEKIETAKEKKFDKLIDAEEKKYQELQKVDYAGLTALMEEVNADGVEQGISLDDLADIHAKEFESRAGKEAINNLWGAIKKATDFTLENHYKTGGLSRDAYTELKNRYKNFVPLRGHDAETAEDKWHYTNGNMGTYYSDPIMRAKGRATRAESPIAYIAQMAHSAILRGNRNTLNQTLLRLAHKDKSGLMNISKTWYVNKGTLEDPIWEMETAPFHDNPDSYIQNQIDFEERMKELEEIGMASQQRKGLDIGGLFIKPKQSEQHEINVDQNGTRYTIYINADPAIARAVNGENSKSIAKGMGFIGNVTRAMAMNFTTRNPLFIARNFSRDYIFANTMLMVKEDATYTARFNENIPLAFAALTRQKKGKLDLNNKTDMYLHEFMMNGGRTGFSHIFELDRVAKRLEKEALKGDSKNALDYGKLALSAIDVVNDVVENATRLSTYMASRQDGRSITQSIHDAKNVTVNFNQKGAGSSIGNNSFERFILSAAGWVRPLYLFTNAAVQALSNVAKATKIHPARMGAAVTSFALMGFMSPIIAGMIGGDDGEEEFMKQTDWDRQNNWIIPTGGGFVKIPLPHEMRVFHRLGDNIYQVATGRKDKLESMLDMVFALSDLLPMNPAGAADASLAELFPDFSKPYGQHLFNTSFMGTRIYNEWANPNAPGYTKVTTNKKGEAYAPAFLIELYKNADHWTGGDGVKKGKISLNPDVTNHYMRGWFGGLWTMTEQIIDIAYKTSEWRKTGEFDLKVRETPISSFYTNKSDLNVSSGSTGNRFYKLSKEVSEIRRQNKGYLKKVNDGEMSIADYAKKVKELDLRRANRINEKIKVVRNMESELKDLKGQEQKELEAKIFKKKKEILEMQ